MLKFFRLFVIILCLLSLNSFGFCNQDSLRNISFTQTIESKKDGKLFEAKTWMKNKNIRMEYNSQGQELVSIIKSSNVYNYSPAAKTGAILDVEKNKDTMQIGPEILQSEKEFLEFLNLMEAKKIGQEIVDNKDCDIYEYMDLDKKITHRIWVWHEFNFPVKLTISAYSDILTISYKNIKFHVNIEDNLFEVPEDIKMQPYTKPE